MRIGVEERIAALEHLVVAHVVAAGVRSPQTAEATLRMAESFRAFAAENDPPGTAEQIVTLLDHLRSAI